MPSHNHGLSALNTKGGGSDPTLSNGFGAATNNIYLKSSEGGTMGNDVINNAGGSQSHENRPPYLALNYCIALTGIYPSRS